MPIHDWTKVDAGTWHDMYVSLIVRTSAALNTGLLPSGFYAMIERRRPEPTADDISHTIRSLGTTVGDPSIAVAEIEPRTQIVSRAGEATAYLRKQNRIAVRSIPGDLIALIEFISPANKSGRANVIDFASEASDLIDAGCHMIVVDLFAPRRNDPRGMIGEIWDRFGGDCVFDPEKPLTIASFRAGGDHVTAHIELTRVGHTLANLPLFLSYDRYVNFPLDAIYCEAYSHVPLHWREVIEA